MFTLWCLTAVIAVAASRATAESYAAQWSLDDGLTWSGVTRVTVEAGVVSTLNGPEEPWSVQQQHQLRAKGTTYRVRLLPSASPADAALALIVHPCALIMARQYAVSLTSTLEKIGVLTAPRGDRALALKWLTPFSEQCDLDIFKANDQTVVRKRNVQFVAMTSMPPPSLPTFGEAEPKAKVAGEAKKAAEEAPKSFFEKYGMYILIFFAANSLISFFGPKGGGNAGAAAAPSK